MSATEALNRRANAAQERTRRLNSETGVKQRPFDQFPQVARKWKRGRWVIARAEHTHRGPNRRHVITTLKEEPQQVQDG